jgi:hypothetical protein
MKSADRTGAKMPKGPDSMPDELPVFMPVQTRIADGYDIAQFGTERGPNHER